VCIDPGWFTNRERFYDGRYAVSEPSDLPYRYVLHRSCGAKGRLLTKLGEDATRPFVDAGWVTWGKGARAYGLNLATKKRRRWRVPHYRSDIGPPEVAQTANTLFLAPPQTDDGSSAPAVTSYDLFAMPLLGSAP
jgi:hypothetical protein